MCGRLLFFTFLFFGLLENVDFWNVISKFYVHVHAQYECSYVSDSVCINEHVHVRTVT